MKTTIRDWKTVMIIVLTVYSLIATMAFLCMNNKNEEVSDSYEEIFGFGEEELEAMFFSGDTSFYDIAYIYGHISKSSSLAYNIILADITNNSNACGEVYHVAHDIYLESGEQPGPIISRLVLDCIEKQARLGSWIGYFNLSQYYSEGLFTAPDTIKSALYKSKQDSLLKMEILRRNGIE